MGGAYSLICIVLKCSTTFDLVEIFDWVFSILCYYCHFNQKEFHFFFEILLTTKKSFIHVFILIITISQTVLNFITCNLFLPNFVFASCVYITVITGNMGESF